MIGIYKIENLINGKVYIGQSINIKERWSEHKLINSRTSKDALKKQKYPLYLAFQKYGLENFSFEVLEECSLEELDTKEQFYIKKYNSYIDFPNSNGYNLTIGGKGNQKITEEQIKQILSLWDSGKSTSEIVRIIGLEKHAILKYLKLFSNTYTIEESEKRGNIKSGLGHRKAIDCYDLWGRFIKTYSSIKEASFELKLNDGLISANCKGKIPRVNNYRFTYEQKEKGLIFLGKFKKDWVIKLSQGEEQFIFPSILQAAKFLETTDKTLKCHLKQNKKIKGWQIEGKNF